MNVIGILFSQTEDPPSPGTDPRDGGNHVLFSSRQGGRGIIFNLTSLPPNISHSGPVQSVLVVVMMVVVMIVMVVIVVMLLVVVMVLPNDDLRFEIVIKHLSVPRHSPESHVLTPIKGRNQ